MKRTFCTTSLATMALLAITAVASHAAPVYYQTSTPSARYNAVSYRDSGTCRCTGYNYNRPVRNSYHARRYYTTRYYTTSQPVVYRSYATVRPVAYRTEYYPRTY